MTRQTLVVGLSATGQSILRYFQRQGILSQVLALDEGLGEEQFQKLAFAFPEAKFIKDSSELNGELTPTLIVKSPGVPFTKPFLVDYKAQGIPIIGDIELFARELATRSNEKVITITGTNGKSTVTHLVGEFLKAAGFAVEVAGNIGLPVLDRMECHPQYWVIELSSFQLETCFSLEPNRAALLNVSDDHLDRYASFDDYLTTKHLVFRGAKGVVFNQDDEKTIPREQSTQIIHSFSLFNETDCYYKKPTLFIKNGNNTIEVNENDVALKGCHNFANVLAAACLLTDEEIPKAAFLSVLKGERGLAHRCQLVREINDVSFVNDSKGTNVGATLSAINGLHQSDKKLILIAGGQSKGADLKPLAEMSKSKLDFAVLIGQDREKLAEALEGNCPYEYSTSLNEAVLKAFAKAKPQGVVLFSPACASFDMFKNFSHRGECFQTIVEGL